MSSASLGMTVGTRKIKALSHIGADGRAQMVNVSAKPMSRRKATASGKIQLKRETLELIAKDQIAKGNVFATARIAGIQAAKQTPHLIPLCHTLPLAEVKIDIVTPEEGAEVRCTARTVAQTGVEMEALVGATVALLTIYDMCKAVDKEMKISDVHLVEKTKRPITTVCDSRARKSRHSSASAQLRRDK